MTSSNDRLRSSRDKYPDLMDGKVEEGFPAYPTRLFRPVKALNKAVIADPGDRYAQKLSGKVRIINKDPTTSKLRF